MQNIKLIDTFILEISINGLTGIILEPPHVKFFLPTFTFIQSISRSSHPEVFWKKGVLRNFSKFTENTCARVSFLIKLQAYFS